MFTRLSLSTRGIVLATAPFMVLVVLIILLIFFLFQIQETKSRELHSKAVVDEAQKLVRQVLAKEVGSVIFGYDAGPISEGSMKLPVDVKIGKFCDLCESAGQPASELVELRQTGVRIAELTRAVDLKDSSGKEINDRGPFNKPILDASAQIFRVLNTVRQFHTKKLESETTHIQQLQERILATLTIGLFSSLLLAGLLVRLYATNVKNPLERIEENSRRLSHREELLPAMTGNDEFSRLDDVVHAVDDAVGQALARERALFNSAADLICSLDPDTCFSRVSPFAKQMLGLSSEELVGRSVMELVLPDDTHVAQNQLSSSMTGGAASNNQFELRLVRNDATVVETRWSVFWSQPDTKLFCVVHDTTEDKVIERLRENFLKLVSQDLRVPLVSIQGSIRRIQGDDPEPKDAKTSLSPKAASVVQSIRRSLDVLVDQVNDLLEFQSVRAGTFALELEDCRLESIIEETLSLLQASAGAKNLKLKASSGSWKVTADAAKVSRVLANFLSNAIKYAPSGTTVSIQVSELPDAFEIAVADNGPGVPIEFREKIFEAFEQVPGTKGGTGLGLAICKSMIEAHGGQVGVRDNVPSGSVFWMQLPRSPRR